MLYITFIQHIVVWYWTYPGEIVVVDSNSYHWIENMVCGSLGSKIQKRCENIMHTLLKRKGPIGYRN